MTRGHETDPVQPFNPEDLQRQLQESDECFHIVDAGEGDETSTIRVSSYHTPIRELTNRNGVKRHSDISLGIIDEYSGQPIAGSPMPNPAAEVTVTIPDLPGAGIYDQRTRPYALYENTTKVDFRFFKAFLHIGESLVPIRLVRIDMGSEPSAYWLTRANNPDL